MHMEESRHILLVEDDPLLVDIYRTRLSQAGFSVDVVSSGDRAVAEVKEHSPDLVLLDIVLPHQDGWDILRDLREEGLLDRTKVIILSNLGQQEDIRKGKELGASAYLIKAHYTPSQIVEEITRIAS